MGFKRQRVELQQSTRARLTRPTRPRTFPNYELELVTFAAVPDDDQQPEEEEPPPEPEEPPPANLDTSDLFAHFIRVQAERAREVFILNGKYSSTPSTSIEPISIFGPILKVEK